MSALPVVVVGAGPVGLAAAAHLLERGVGPVVLEAGPVAASAVRSWGHVRLFSTWSELVDAVAARRLRRRGWSSPDARAYPTGREWADHFLQPLADSLAPHVRYGARVVGVARRGRDLVVDAGRDGAPFAVHVDTGGTTETVLARAVVDASGTWGQPNPLGADGYQAAGEASAADCIVYRIPDLRDPSVRARYAGRHVAVAGSGHSAVTAVVDLARLAQNAPGTRVTWLLRRGASTGLERVYGGGAADQLPARGALGEQARQAVASGLVQVRPGFRTDAVEPAVHGSRTGLRLVPHEGPAVEVDEVVVLTGLRPDLTWLSEVRLDLDPTLQAPRVLAPLIDPNVHSCGSVPPHGAAELEHPEPGLYLAGMKSYGRAPTFLALTGYEQVRSIAAALAGDADAAARVELVLPETGVCGGAGLLDAVDQRDGDAGCCGAPSTSPVGARGLVAGD